MADDSRVADILEVLRSLPPDEFGCANLVVHRGVLSGRLTRHGLRSTANYMDDDVRSFCTTLSSRLREATGRNEFYTLIEGEIRIFL